MQSTARWQHARQRQHPVWTKCITGSSTVAPPSLHVKKRREAKASEFERPVLLYPIGKDLSVMLRLAQKAFHPGLIPFPLLHIDTTATAVSTGLVCQRQSS